MVNFFSFLTLAGLLVPAAYADDDSTLESCVQFSVNGTWQEYFNFYRHYDFRYSNALDTEIKRSNWPKNRDNETKLAQFKRFKDDSWTDEWSIRTTNKAPATEKLLALNYNTGNVFMGNSPLMSVICNCSY